MRMRCYSHLRISLLLIAIMLCCVQISLAKDFGTSSAPQSEGELLYSDNFSDPKSGWYRSSNPDRAYVYEDGKYHIIINKPNWWYTSNLGKNFSDFVMETEATLEDGPAASDYGILMRYINSENFHSFQLRGDGNYMFGGQKGGEPFTITPWTQRTDAIRTNNSANLIRIVCDGDMFSFYVNGEWLEDAYDDTFAYGDIVFLVGALGGNSTHVSFDNLTIWSVE